MSPSSIDEAAALHPVRDSHPSPSPDCPPAPHEAVRERASPGLKPNPNPDRQRGDISVKAEELELEEQHEQEHAEGRMAPNPRPREWKPAVENEPTEKEAAEKADPAGALLTDEKASDAAEEPEHAWTERAPRRHRPMDAEADRARTSAPGSAGSLAGSEASESRETLDTRGTHPRRTPHPRVRRNDTVLTVASHRPFRIRPGGHVEGPWLREKERATELLSLFFDLVVVAVLTVFSNTHKIQSAAAIPVFFSYYIVITWIWTSQVHYDSRYEAEDTYHRLAKCLQIIVFVYCGAASGGWNPGQVVSPEYLPDLSESQQVAYQQAVDSFLVVAVAFAIYRLLLFGQYLVIIRDGRRTKNQVWGAKISATTLCVSCVIGIIAIAIPPRSNARGHTKIAMFYLAIAVEMAGAWCQLSTGTMGAVKAEHMAARYAALTLMIMGEGFVNLATAFSNAISGLSVSNLSSYAQVFLVILIMCNIWSFIFSDFSKTQGRFALRRRLVWEFIHFPLHFAILLLMAAMVNVVLLGTFSISLGTASDRYETVLESLVDGTVLDERTLSATSIYLNRLNIVPSFMEEYYVLQWGFNQTLNPVNETGIDPLALSLQYYGQIVTALAAKSGVLIQSGPAAELASLAGFAPFLEMDDSETYMQAIAWFQQTISTVVDDAVAGTYWLYPTAGGVLILTSLRAMIRYESRSPKHRIFNGFSCLMGLALGLLGLLVIGGEKVRLTDEGDVVGGNRMAALVRSNWSMAVVVFVYSFVTVAQHVIPGMLEREERKHERAGDNGGG